MYIVVEVASVQNLLGILLAFTESPDEDGVPPTVLPPQISTDVDTLKRSWAQLQEERDFYREKFNEQERKIQRLTRQLENERILNDYVRTDKKSSWEH